jgi:hypothetical protein
VASLRRSGRTRLDPRSKGIIRSENAELLLAPHRRTLIDRLRGHVALNVAHRTHGHAAPFATASRLGRHPVRQMRELAHA